MKQNFYGSALNRGNDEIIVAGFDVETDGLGGELLSVQSGVFGEVEFDTSENAIHRLIDKMEQYPLPVVWYGHFAQYDWRYFMDAFLERGTDVQFQMRNDTAMYQITIKRPDGKRVVMRDSFAIWPGKLEDLAKSFCPEFPKLKIDIENFDVANPEHIAYAKRDVQILLVGLPRLFAMLRDLFGIEPNGTSASTAQKAWMQGLGTKKYTASTWDEREEFIRSAYYGGLVFLTRTDVQENAETYDLNSSYPSVMCDFGVPDGTACRVTEFETDRMGIYRARVRTPKNLVVPILPSRNAAGSMRWLRGEFDTVVTNRELIFAANNGYEILEIYEGIVWERTAFPFSDFVNRCKSVRVKFKGLAQEILAKLMQNSLYGRFGARRERLRILAAHNTPPEELDNCIPYDDEGNWYIKKEFDDEMRCKPEWAVFITAHARLKLLQSVYSVGVDNVFYGDTDSITVRAGCGGSLDVGSDYGQWKLEKEWEQFRAIAPKVYSGILKSGARVAAAKGLPKKGVGDDQARELLEKGVTHASTQSLDSLRVTLKKGVCKSTTLTRVSSSLERSINFEEWTPGRARPKIAA